MRRLFSVDGPLPPVFLPIGAALIALAVARSPAQALEAPPAPPVARSFMIFIPQSDGYGISECLKAETGCARVVANSWCSAKGYGKALAWGASADMTAKIATASTKTPPGSFAISCAE